MGVAFLGFSEHAVEFLAELSRHNQRAWFEAHRDAYQRFVLQPAEELVVELGARLRELDPKLQAIPRVRGSIKALERRVRFQKSELTPYNPHLDLWFWSGRRRAWDNSGFYLRLGVTRLVLAAGMIEFQKETLARYRHGVLDDQRGPALATIVGDLRSHGYQVGGEGYKRTPPGVPPDFARASLSKHRGLFTTLDGEHPPELGAATFVDFCFAHFARMTPLHGWLVAMREQNS